MPNKITLKKKNHIELKTKSEKIFDIANTVFLILITLLAAYPLYYTVIASFSEPELVIRGKITLWIKGFTLDSYKEVLKYKSVINGYKNSLIYTVSGCLYGLAILLPCAYALSKKTLKGRGVLGVFFMFTMYFSGGMIPTYLNFKSLGLIDSPLVLIIPAGFSVYNMLITKTFFESNFSESLAEAARIDGAGVFRIFFQLALPLSGAIIAVMTLYIAVRIWNSYFDALLYIQNADYYPLQLIMRQILNAAKSTSAGGDAMSEDAIEAILRQQRLAMTMRYSLVILANLPVLIAYPFVQKYFVKGVMIGAVKG